MTISGIYIERLFIGKIPLFFNEHSVCQYNLLQIPKEMQMCDPMALNVQSLNFYWMDPETIF